jgi:hypothetical protein
MDDGNAESIHLKEAKQNTHDNVYIFNIQLCVKCHYECSETNSIYITHRIKLIYVYTTRIPETGPLGVHLVCSMAVTMQQLLKGKIN